jgi:hypothetical protein
MNQIHSLWLLAGLILVSAGARAVPAAHAPAGPAPSTASLVLNGRHYAPLVDWAESRNLKLSWLKRDESLQVTNAATRLLLTVDS